MAGKPVGTIYAELDLDTSKYTAAQKKILYDSQTMAINQENAWKNLGQKSDLMYEAMRKQATNAYQRIASDSKSSAAEIVRAEEAKNAKIKTINDQQFGAQFSLIETLRKNWIAAAAAVYAAWSLIQKAGQWVELGAKVKSIEDSFVLMAKNAGIAVDGLVDKLKKATAETIDDSDLMVKATRLIAEGFAPEQIVVIAEASRTAARLTGKTVSEAYEGIADSIVNLRQRGLKTAGFIIDMDEAERKHAATLGVTKDQLNDYGKQMAWANALKEKNIELTQKLGIDQATEYENLQKINAAMKEFKDDVGKAAASVWTGFEIILGKVAKAAQAAGSAIEYLGKKLRGVIGIGKESPVLGAEELYAGIGGAFAPAAGTKSQIKGMSDTEIKKMADMADKAAESWTKVQGAVYGTTEALSMYDYGLDGTAVKLDDLIKRQDAENKAAEDLAQTMADEMFPSLEKINKMIDQGEKYWIDYNKQLAISKDLIKDMDWESVASGMTELSSESERAISLNRMAIEQQVDTMKRSNEFMESFSQAVSDVWANNVSRMITDAESAKDALSNIFKGIADAFISAVIKMIIQWLIFDNLTKSGSQGSLWGSIIKGVFSIAGSLGGGVSFGGTSPGWGGYAGGGWAGYPYSYQRGGYARTPQFARLAEHEPEYVIPESKMNNMTNKDQGQTANIFHIVCMDPISWRDFVRRNPDAIIEALNKDARGAGTMRGTIKGVG